MHGDVKIKVFLCFVWMSEHRSLPYTKLTDLYNANGTTLLIGRAESLNTLLFKSVLVFKLLMDICRWASNWLLIDC
jgi:hypothetical protein